MVQKSSSHFSASGIALAVCVSLSILLLIIYVIRFRYAKHKVTPNVAPLQIPDKIINTHYKSPDQVKERQIAITSMYIPKAIGDPTGKFRLFNTSKGLRSYEINSMGLPIPHQISAQN